MTFTAASTVIDVRGLAPRESRPTVFSTYRALDIGEALELVDDHDPRSLFTVFQAEARSDFAWICLQNGPQLWRVSIRKLGTAA